MTSSRITAALVHEMNKRVTGNAAAFVIKPNELHSAVERPAQLAYYVPSSSIAARAASLAFGIILNHPFLDGNKRTAQMAANAYLQAEGHRPLVKYDHSAQDNIAMARVVEAHRQVAMGNMSGEDLADLYNNILSH
ncbi:hypothetical protein DFH11DRAFT_996900 [Phellopilus nigrolimitatus]|nr:hypothetical protein DFH11DRAFT_996900 [Phellopilus nigrolimitatus]